MRPFSDGSVVDTLRAHISALTSEIDRLENDYVLKASATELEQHYVDRALVNAIELRTADKSIETKKTTSTQQRDYGREISVPATLLRIAIPYVGDKVLWSCRGSTYHIGGHPEIDVYDDRIVLPLTFPDESASAEEMQRQIDAQIANIQKTLNWVNSDVETHNRTAANTIRDALALKRKRAEKVLNAVRALNIPLKRRDQEPTYDVPARRRPSPISRPTVTQERFAPEPVLKEEEYEFILKILKSMSLVMERSPAAFATLDEEHIRTHFLLALNSHYEGQATGETFNAAGKTDILIRAGDRNVFIAECKFWRGPKSFTEAVDQLLGYLSWRDSKCALLVFNPNRDSSAVKEKMHEIMTSRSEHRQTVVHDSDGLSRYVFVKASDPGREIHICTMLFDVPRP